MPNPLFEQPKKKQGLVSKIVDGILSGVAVSLAVWLMMTGIPGFPGLLSKSDPETGSLAGEQPAKHITPNGTTYVGGDWEAGAVDGSGTRAQELVSEETGLDVKVMFVEAPCGNKPQQSFVNGCVDTKHPSIIFLSTGSGELEETNLHAMVTHELAHVYQLRLDPQFLNDNPTVTKLFSGSSPAEPLADCMTEQKLGYQLNTYISSCNAEQLAVSRQVWEGLLP